MRTLLFLFLAFASAAIAESRRPNFIFILCDDLGWGDIGAFGQKKIRTPNLDRMAKEGMKLTAHYSGHNVCAPSRNVLLSGKHPGHAYIRENRGGLGKGQEGQEPVPAGHLTLPLALKERDYVTGCVGKWGLGPVGSTGDPLKQGFDRFYGYNCQALAHNFYPDHLWSDSQRVELKNPASPAHQKLPTGADPKSLESYKPYTGTQYSADLIAEEGRAFVRANKDRPFFLYYATTVPHLALQVPEDSLKEYEGAFPEEPYTGNRGYLPHPKPRAAYAAMITRMDREIGKLMDLVKELGMDERTIFVFTSDNGPLYDRLGGTDAEFFQSAGPFRGSKGSFFEGGFRVPCIVRWNGRIGPGSESDHVSGFEDWLPTFLDILGEQAPAGIDGISLFPTLRGEKQPPRPFLYRESPGYGGQQMAREGDWKLLRRNLQPRPKDKEAATLELYDLSKDPGETTNVAAQHPEIVERLQQIAREQHTPSTLFPIRALDGQ